MAAQAKPGDALVVFGITGDLARKMTLRSLYRLAAQGRLGCPVIGVAVQDWTDDHLGENAREAVTDTEAPVTDSFAQVRPLRDLLGSASTVADAVRKVWTPVATDVASIQNLIVQAPNVIASASCDRPTEVVADGIDVTRAEFEYAVTHEGALSVDDIVDRRTRIGLVDTDRERVVTVAEELLTHCSSR